MPNNTPATGPPEESTFGNFEILRDASGAPLLLGRGTFGRTYQARHRYLETVAALKIISERFATDTAARASFLTEARAAARLSHPHIARLHDFGEKDGVLFYAMEFCAGGDLGDYVKKHGPLTPAQLLEVAGQVGGALQCAHAAGLVHRDIKPSNVMLASNELPLATRLIDFGLVHVHGAAAADGESAETRLLGTPLFSSPEQLREETADARADLFSLGMTLWYLALGRAPENGSLAEITASRLNAESYARRLPETLPGRLQSALARLLEKDPAKRFASAAEFLQAIGRDGERSAGVSETRAPVDAGTRTEGEGEGIELETVDSPLREEWQLGSRHNETLTGLNYPATAARDAKEQVWLHVIDERLLRNVDLLWRVRRNAARCAGLRLPGLLTPLAMRRYSDYAAVILEKPDCVSLISTLHGRTAGAIAELYPVLEKIAETCDAVSAAWLPGVDLQPANIWLLAASGDAKGTETGSAQPKLFPRFLAAREAPELAEATGPNDAGATITAEMVTSPGAADDMHAHFARLIYRLYAGRNCPAAASLAVQAYVAVPNLSEQANRTLASVIARQLEYPSCKQLLVNLRRSEGVASAATAAHTTGARATAARLTHATSPTIAAGPVVPAPARVAPAPKRGVLIGAAVFLVLLIIGVLGYRALVSRPKPPPVSTEPGEIESFPADAKLRLAGAEIPAHATFSIAGTPVNAQRNSGEILLSLGNIPRRFPLDLVVEATGFKKSAITLKDDAALNELQPLSLFRSTGRILFVGLPSDYTHASASMKSLLPGETALDDVRLERADRGTEIRAGGRNAIELATGAYAINLRGDNGRAVRPRNLGGPYEVKADETVTIPLPATFAGRYKGTVTDPAAGNEKLELEIAIEPGLMSGELIERRGDVTRRGAWSDGQIDAEGFYKARVRFEEADAQKPAEVRLVLRAIDEKKIALAGDAAGASSSGREQVATYTPAGELLRGSSKAQP